MEDGELEELIKDIEKYGVRGMRWRQRRRQQFKERSTRDLINIMSSLETRAHHQKIRRLIMSELRARPGGMAALAASQRRAEAEHRRRWGKR